MIELVNVTKWFPTDFGRHYVFRDVSLRLPPDKSVGVIGPNGAGKSTFLRIIAGADTPNEGRVIRTGRISPPMGLTPSIQGSLTGAENTRFACRIYGMNRDEAEDVVESVGELAGIGKFYNMPVSTYSAGMKQRVAFSISMMLKYDYYLFDEISAGGDREFQQISKRMVEERLATSKFVITSHRIDELVGLCEACIVIMNGELRYFDKIADGVSYYGETYDLTSLNEKIERKAKRKERKSQKESGGEPVAKVGKRAAKRDLKQQQKAALAADPQGAAATAPDDGKTKPARKRRNKLKAPVIGEGPAEAPAGVPQAVQSTPVPVRIPARKDLPMAPRIMPLPAGPNLDADQKIALLREQLASRAAAKSHGDPPAVPSLPEAGSEVVSESAKPSRKGRRKRRKLALQEAAAAGPESAMMARQALALRSQELAAHAASRAMRLLLLSLDRNREGEAHPGLERILPLAARAQELAAKAALAASAARLGMTEGEPEGDGLPPASKAETTPAGGRRARKGRKARRTKDEPEEGGIPPVSQAETAPDESRRSRKGRKARRTKGELEGNGLPPVSQAETTPAEGRRSRKGRKARRTAGEPEGDGLPPVSESETTPAEGHRSGKGRKARRRERRDQDTGQIQLESGTSNQ